MLFRRSIAPELPGSLREKLRKMTMVDGNMAKLLDVSDPIVVIAAREGDRDFHDPAGWALYDPVSEWVGVYVSPAHRGTGIARQLAKVLAVKLRKQVRLVPRSVKIFDGLVDYRVDGKDPQMERVA